jgi:hypothetical protein
MTQHLSWFVGGRSPQTRQGLYDKMGHSPLGGGIPGLVPSEWTLRCLVARARKEGPFGLRLLFLLLRSAPGFRPVPTFPNQ